MAREDVVHQKLTLWKKHARFLYDLVVSYPLQWPSYTVQWVPSEVRQKDPYNVHQLLLGTRTNKMESNFIMIADLYLPRNDGSAFEALPETYIPEVKIVEKIHVGMNDVYRARSMIQDPSLVAAKTSSADVYVFNRNNPNENNFEPLLTLKGHAENGLGLSWNSDKEGYLLSGSEDDTICLWDINKDVHPIDIFEEHTKGVGDVSWHSENLFGSVGDDCRLILWDRRAKNPLSFTDFHKDEVNSLSFNPFNEWVLATGSSDSTVGIFDRRNLKFPLHLLNTHGKVYQVEWDPYQETVLASAYDVSSDRLDVWDLNRIGEEQLKGEKLKGENDDGPVELLFSHGGHVAAISDFSWNKTVPRVISSVSEENNTLQIWQMAKSFYPDDGQ